MSNGLKNLVSAAKKMEWHLPLQQLTPVTLYKPTIPRLLCTDWHKLLYHCCLPPGIKQESEGGVGDRWTRHPMSILALPSLMQYLGSSAPMQSCLPTHAYVTGLDTATLSLSLEKAPRQTMIRMVRSVNQEQKAGQGHLWSHEFLAPPCKREG